MKAFFLFLIVGLAGFSARGLADENLLHTKIKYFRTLHHDLLAKVAKELPAIRPRSCPEEIQAALCPHTHHCRTTLGGWMPAANPCFLDQHQPLVRVPFTPEQIVGDINHRLEGFAHIRKTFNEWYRISSSSDPIAQRVVKGGESVRRLMEDCSIRPYERYPSGLHFKESANYWGYRSQVQKYLEKIFKEDQLQKFTTDVNQLVVELRANPRLVNDPRWKHFCPECARFEQYQKVMNLDVESAVKLLREDLLFLQEITTFTNHYLWDEMEEKVREIISLALKEPGLLYSLPGWPEKEIPAALVVTPKTFAPPPPATPGSAATSKRETPVETPVINCTLLGTSCVIVGMLVGHAATTYHWRRAFKEVQRPEVSTPVPPERIEITTPPEVVPEELKTQWKVIHAAIAIEMGSEVPEGRVAEFLAKQTSVSAEVLRTMEPENERGYAQLKLLADTVQPGANAEFDLSAEAQRGMRALKGELQGMSEVLKRSLGFDDDRRTHALRLVAILYEINRRFP